ncbi:hypothetical protein MLD38_002180 [Melastoma candidum]|uniref:Uncharacterized protein n=1 Tax=Melastoma candidum TaxID=119954 RepID=A0ACB9SG12_9MYRT|nr:hypothetical protein MLD38_002180 [Melastoma candidum]
MTSIWKLDLRQLPFAQPLVMNPERSSSELLRLNHGSVRLSAVRSRRGVFLKACGSDGLSSMDSKDNSGDGNVIATAVSAGKESSLDRLRGIVASFPPIVYVTKRKFAAGYAIGLFVVTAFVFVSVRVYLARKVRKSPPGTVADLVRRGQLRSDRRGMSRPLKYEDPFNNPLIKAGKRDSTLEMCGKVYRLAPTTLTEEQQDMHKRRRSRAYQWKRPTVFLKEGDPIPADVDPETVRWIPANHPFATTAGEIDEDLAQNNVYKQHGVPFRIQAEHDELQRKLEALQRDQKLDKLVIDRSNAKNFERPYKLQGKPNEIDQSPPDGQLTSPSSPESDPQPIPSSSKLFPDETQKS